MTATPRFIVSLGSDMLGAAFVYDEQIKMMTMKCTLDIQKTTTCKIRVSESLELERLS